MFPTPRIYIFLDFRVYYSAFKVQFREKNYFFIHNFKILAVTIEKTDTTAKPVQRKRRRGGQIKKTSKKALEMNQELFK